MRNETMSNVKIQTVHTIKIPVYPQPDPEQNSFRAPSAPSEQNIVLNPDMAEDLWIELGKLLGH